jgi:hypothetical protein
VNEKRVKRKDDILSKEKSGRTLRIKKVVARQLKIMKKQKEKIENIGNSSFNPGFLWG